MQIKSLIIDKFIFHPYLLSLCVQHELVHTYSNLVLTLAFYKFSIFSKVLQLIQYSF